MMASSDAAPKAAAQPQLLKGIVKSVLSGDTVIIRGKPVNGPPPERQLSLGHCSAPRLARRPGANAPDQNPKDEPFAWESREFLRKKVLGKEVEFTVDYAIPASGRQFGQLYLPAAAAGGKREDVIKASVAAGWLRVRADKAKTAENDELLELEVAAAAGKLGLHTEEEARKAAAVRATKWNVENPRMLVEEHKGTPVDALIEQVRDGSTLRLFLLPSFQYVTLLMSGIKSPTFKRGGQGEDGKGPSAEVAEPFAEEAKYFVESRLLQREVQVRLEGSSNNNVIGTVIHPAGNIATSLLGEGLAKIVDWSMANVATGKELYRAAEKTAKEKKLRLWRNYTPASAATPITEKEFSGRVMEIVNAETIVVKAASGLKRVQLASVRGPKAPPLGEGETRGRQTVFDVPYLFEAREFLRKKLIGKKVQVVVDFMRAAEGNYPERCCATVTADGVNIAEALVSKGLATVLMHRNDDDQRSAAYDDLLVAEQRAKKGAKGVHSPKPPPVHRVSDLQQDSAKAKNFFPFLQRAGRTHGVVEYAASGSRFKVYLPKETSVFTLVLAGISCPRTGRQGQPSEPWADEALQFVKERVLQRDVEVLVDAQDKSGNMIGALFVNDSTNVAVELVAAGLATVHFTADRLAYHQQLLQAEAGPKAKRLKVWENFKEEPAAAAVADAPEEKERKVSYRDVLASEVRADGSFYAQLTKDGPELDTLMGNLRVSFEATPPVAGAYTPKGGELCAARFSEDDAWYRAKVLKAAKDGQSAHVIYVDYGNEESVPAARLAALPSNFAALAAQAKRFQLACVALPADGDWKAEALDFLRHHLLGAEKLQVNVEYTNTSSNETFVTAFNPKTKQDVGKELVAQGLATVEKRREQKLQSLLREYTVGMDKARKERRCIWEYGDVFGDDAREFGYTKVVKE